MTILQFVFRYIAFLLTVPPLVIIATFRVFAIMEEDAARQRHAARRKQDGRYFT